MQNPVVQVQSSTSRHSHTRKLSLQVKAQGISEILLTRGTNKKNKDYSVSLANFMTDQKWKKMKKMKKKLTS